MELSIYINQQCWGCDEAHRLAEQMRQTFPELTVRLIDLNTAGADKPEQVFATPTYLLNGRVVSLGNPRAEALRGWIEAELGRG